MTGERLCYIVTTPWNFVAARGFPKAVDILNLSILMDNPDKDDIYIKIYNSQRPLVIPDVSQYPSWRQMAELPATQSWLGIPLIREGEVTGMLSLARETGDPYGEEDVTLATAFAGQAAIALANARLYNRVERFNQQLEYEVRQRTRELRHAYDRLERLDRAKSDFISITSHELRTPLTLVQGYSAMLLNDGGIKDNAYYQDLVKGINSGAVRLHEIVNYMLDMVKIENRTLELMWEPVTLGNLLHSVYKKFEEDLQERGMTMHIENLDALPTIEADKDALYKVFYHLAMNAIKYTPDGGEIIVSGTLQPNGLNDWPGESVEIVVKDTGIGIDPEVSDLIFTKFYQMGKVALHSSGKTKFKGGGPGLGLAIVKGIIEVHHGQVWVESAGYDEDSLPGSQFHVVLPVSQLQPAPN